ncbi:beta-ketoacyl synthase N-terminal-like domain-containing protein [Streptomyces sp. NPDC001941]|uniref:beta-ketoacyl synthase N-terminal-like domain-containing protein n=1 Tax=Streptomyces sp. NPDC001941 TaxID=3154659 RepID=UPI00333310DB
MEQREPVAIVGMAVTLPGAADLDTYWRNLVAGVDAISDVPPGRLDAEDVYCRRGGFVDGLADFDPTAFGVMPDSVATTEPDQLIALRTAAAAIADAGGLSADPARTGVVLGRGGYLTAGLARLDQRVRTARQLARTLRELMPELPEERLAEIRTAFTDALGPDSPESVIGLVPNFAASRIANRLDLRGPAYTVDAACASSLVAVDQAVAELAAGRCDVMLAGGVHHCHDITLWSVFERLRALSPSQRIRPFHRDADGVLMGEGTGVVVLKRLADARRDGDRVYAVVRGTGVAGDGRAASLVNPDPGGQARAVRLAWEAAGLDPAAPGSIGLLEAHGTGTPNGDGAELATLAEVFGSGREPDAVVGSVKSMIGHTMPAAGVAGLIKAALAVHRGVLLPTLHCDEPHPDLERTRFRTLPEARPWDAGVRRAAVNAFGFGGINAHVVIESAAPAPALRVSEPEPLLRLAADTPEALAALLDADDARVRDLDRTRGAARLAISGPTAKRLSLARKAVARGGAWGGRSDVWYAPEPVLGAGGGRTAFLFPGLEAEFAPQVDDLARHFGLPAPGRQGARVGDVAEHGAGVVGVGRLLSAALERIGVVPDAVAGHSVGEWTAMVAGGMFADAEVDAFLASFDPEALRVPGLAFAAFGTGAQVVAAALDRHPGVVLSHDNAPRQSVACGPAAQVEALAAELRAEGVIGQVLPFESGFHTPMLRPYLAPIQDATLRFALHEQRVPVWSGTTCAPFPADGAGVRELFVRHLLEPVRFRGLVEGLYAAGARAFVQLGTGQLPALVGDTLAGRDHLAITANSPRREGLAQLRCVAAGLWAFGGDPDFDALAHRRRGVPLDLGAALVSLPPSVGTLTAPAAPAAAPVAATASASGVPELDALLAETARAVADVSALGGARAPRPVPVRVRPPGPVPVSAPAAPAPYAPAPVKRTLDISVDALPYLRDHCFFKQRPDWPDLADRWPVVPATTIVQMLLDAVPADAGTPVAVHDARFLEWVVAEPRTSVDLVLEPGAPGRFRAAFGRHARAEVETAAGYRTAPARWPVPDGERAPEVSAARMYAERWMFHGPLFQGVSAITALGGRHVRGELTAPPAPGALLDNVGQLLGYWLMATHTDRTVVFPVGIRRAELFGPHPAPGTRLDCHIRVTALTDTLLEADVELADRATGAVWARIEGWQDRRFDSPPETDAVKRRPEHSTLSETRPGGWELVFERWPDPASRDLMMRNQLAGAERERYERHAPRGKRQWLLGRIAAKDAVRRALWAADPDEPVYPGEVRVRNEPSGRPVPEGVHGRELPPLELSLAHCQDAAVALVRPAGTPVGIDIEEVVERTDATVDAVLGPDEHALYARLGGGAEQLTRLWCAKEAAAKAEGTGLGGRPRDFTVVEATGDTARVRTPSGRVHRIRTAGVANPPGLRDRKYTVAWTEETEQP